MSEGFTNLEDAGRHKKQAYLALETGKEVHPEGETFLFCDYVNYCIARQLLRVPEWEVYVHPALSVLEKMDEASNFSNVDTLMAYLGNSRELSKTAAALHIHKSTLTYRLQKIQDLCGIDLENPNVRTQLILSKCMRDLEKKADLETHREGFPI